jgi:hypothetical protein
MAGPWPVQLAAVALLSDQDLLDATMHIAGGPSTTDNLQLRCRAHNAHEAKREFGRPYPVMLSRLKGQQI